MLVKLWYESSTNSADRYDSEFSRVLESRKSFVSHAAIIIIISQLYNRKYSAGRNRTGVCLLGVNNNPFI